jgi:hypothetical protein
MADMPPPPSVPPPPSGDPALPPRSFGQIFGAALDIYRRNAAQLLTIVAIVVIPLSIISFLIVRVALAPGTTRQQVGDVVIEVPEARSLIVILLAAGIGAAIAIIINSILQAATMRGASLASLGEPVDISDSYRWGMRRFGSVLLVAVLVGLGVLGGLILLIIPGIIFLVMWSVSIPAVVVEGKRGTEAMRRSWQLVRGHFWFVLGVVVVTAIITSVVSSIFSAIAGESDILALILNTIGQIITAPFAALVTVVLYLDLRTKTENLTMTGLRGELERSV